MVAVHESVCGTFETCRAVPPTSVQGKTGSDRRIVKPTRLTDAVEKVFLNHGAQILRAVGASIRKFLGGNHHQIVNLPMTSVMELRGHRMAIAACFAFQREISSSVLRDFFDSIDPTQT
jgi:hypothetical protein